MHARPASAAHLYLRPARRGRSPARGCPAAKREFRKQEPPTGAACRGTKSHRTVRGARAATACSDARATPEKRRQSSAPESLRIRFRVKNQASGSSVHVLKTQQTKCELDHTGSQEKPRSARKISPVNPCGSSLHPTGASFPFFSLAPAFEP